MGDVRLRPRYRLRVGCPPEQVLDELQTVLDGDANEVAGVTGSVYDTSAVLRIPEDRRNFWSPELQVGIDSESDSGARDGSGSIVTCLFGPRPAVWGMYVALYMTVIFLAIMGGSYGTSQIMLGQSASAFWSLPAAALAAVIVYLIGRFGRRLGGPQMGELRTALDRALDRCGGATEVH